MYCSERGSTCSRQAALFAQLSLRDIPHAWSLAHTLGLNDDRVWSYLAKAYGKLDLIAALPAYAGLVERELAVADAGNYQSTARRSKMMRRLRLRRRFVIAGKDQVAGLMQGGPSLAVGRTPQSSRASRLTTKPGATGARIPASFAMCLAELSWKLPNTRLPIHASASLMPATGSSSGTRRAPAHRTTEAFGARRRQSDEASGLDKQEARQEHCQSHWRSDQSDQHPSPYLPGDSRARPEDCRDCEIDQHERQDKDGEGEPRQKIPNGSSLDEKDVHQCRHERDGSIGRRERLRHP